MAKKPGARKPRKSKVSPRKTTRRKGGSSRSRRARRGGTGRGRLLIGLAVLALLVVGAYGVYLSSEVRVAFEGKRWAIPARVYARPLELYEGASLSPEQLRYELQILGYNA